MSSFTIIKVFVNSLFSRSGVDNRTTHKILVDDDCQDPQQQNANAAIVDPLACIIGIREYDVPYTMRVAIDLDVRVGAWYLVTPEYGSETCSVSAIAR